MSRRPVLLALVAVLFLPALSSAQTAIAVPVQPDAFFLPAGECTATCPGNTKVTCDGSSCSAKDDEGCRYKDTDGQWKQKTCPVALTIEGDAKGRVLDTATTTLSKPVRGADGTWRAVVREPLSALPASRADQIEGEIDALNAVRLELTGEVVDLDPRDVTVRSDLFLASCTADCGNGKTVTCIALGDAECFAVDGVACQVYRPGAIEAEHVSCRDAQ